MKIDTTFNLGDTILLCGDRNFKCVVIAIELRIGGGRYYKLKWRNGRSFTEEWFAEAEIFACEKLDD